MNPTDYQTALDSNDTEMLQRAYDHAMHRICDMRYKATTRAAAREYLPQLTTALCAALRT